MEVCLYSTKRNGFQLELFVIILHENIGINLYGTSGKYIAQMVLLQLTLGCNLI